MTVAARAPLALAAALAAAVAGCGPIPVDQAERACLEDARAARGPQGSLALGVGSNGHRTVPLSRVELSISSDYLMGRDPSDVFNRCVVNRAGQMPTRPLAAQPGWRG